MNLPVLEARECNIKAFCPQDVANHLIDATRNIMQETFWVMVLNCKNIATHEVVISVGTLNSSLVHPREVFKPAILLHAAAIIVAHNHPSKSTEPSEKDISVTKQLVKSGKILGIPVLDHIIVGGNEYYSFQENGILGGKKV